MDGWTDGWSTYGHKFHIYVDLILLFNPGFLTSSIILTPPFITINVSAPPLHQHRSASTIVCYIGDASFGQLPAAGYLIGTISDITNFEQQVEFWTPKTFPFPLVKVYDSEAHFSCNLIKGHATVGTAICSCSCIFRGQSNYTLLIAFNFFHYRVIICGMPYLSGTSIFLHGYGSDTIVRNIRKPLFGYLTVPPPVSYDASSMYKFIAWLYH